MKVAEGNIWIRESFLNQDEGYIFGESDVYETYTDDTGRLFRDLQREYGRCVSKVYVDAEGGPKAVGWVFEGRQQYEDTGETYMREVWVTLYEPETEEVMVPQSEHKALVIGGTR